MVDQGRARLHPSLLRLARHPEIDDTLKVDAYGGSILTLPTKHVNSITSVLVDGRELSDQID